MYMRPNMAKEETQKTVQIKWKWLDTLSLAILAQTQLD